MVVAVATVGHVGAVEEEGHVMELLVVVVGLDDREHVALQELGADDEEGDVCPTGDDGAIRHDLYWRTVEEDKVVLLTELCHKLLQTGGEEELGGVRGQGAHRDDIELTAALTLCHEGAPVCDLTVEVVGQAGLWVVHQGAEGGSTHVEVDGYDFLILDGEGGCEVHGDEGLTTARIG